MRMCGAEAPWHAVLIEESRDMRAGPSQCRFEQRRIHDSAFAGDIAMLQRRQRADYRPHRGADVDDRHADPRRRPVWIAVDAENAAEGLRHRFESRQHAHRAAITEARDLAIDQPRMTRADTWTIDAERIDDSRPRIVNEDVRSLEQSVKLLHADGAFKIERDRRFVAIDVEEMQRIAVPERRAHVPGHRRQAPAFPP